MNCESFTSPLAVPNPPGRGTAWHESVWDRNVKWSEALLDMLGEKGVSGPFVDIGCGIGSVLYAAQKRNIAGTGFDLNEDAIRYGREKHGLDLRAEYWTADSMADFGCILCISVLEHIHYPRPMIQEILGAAKEKKAAAYLSVPFFNRNGWRALLTDSTKPGHRLNQPHVHVTHFSHTGMEKVCREFGAEAFEIVSIPGAWTGALVRF